MRTPSEFSKGKLSDESGPDNKQGILRIRTNLMRF